MIYCQARLQDHHNNYMFVVAVNNITTHVKVLLRSSRVFLKQGCYNTYNNYSYELCGFKQTCLNRFLTNV